jgi:hypothetical protein
MIQYDLKLLQFYKHVSDVTLYDNVTLVLTLYDNVLVLICISQNV